MFSFAPSIEYPFSRTVFIMIRRSFPKYFLFTHLLAVLFLFSCKNDAPPSAETAGQKPKPDTIRMVSVPTEGARTFVITEGVVNWSASKAVGSGHSGAINISGGEISVNQGTILGGKVTMDMASVQVPGMKDTEERRDLESHLKSADFFDVAKFPRAEFTVEEIMPSTLPDFNVVVRGNLTLKGVSSPVNIPLKFSLEGDVLRAESPTFTINRTKWGINFRSEILGTVKDKIIQDMVPLSIKLTARAK